MVRRLLFLDIDGVLNCDASTPYLIPDPEIGDKYLGIDEDKLQNLKYIINETGAEIWLTSTWKARWYRIHKENQDVFANEIDKRFASVGLKVTDKTYDGMISGRGCGIRHVVNTLEPAPTSWAVVDDEYFADYAKFDIDNHLVQTDWRTEGLTKEKAEEIIKILKK